MLAQDTQLVNGERQVLDTGCLAACILLSSFHAVVFNEFGIIPQEGLGIYGHVFWFQNNWEGDTDFSGWRSGMLDFLQHRNSPVQ